MTYLLLLMIAAREPCPVIGPLSPQIAVIETSASTNSAGLSIAVERSGTLTVRRCRDTRAVHADKDLATKLYLDLDRAGRLDDLSGGHCMKSASFGTSTAVLFGGSRSPDLQCPQNATERTLRTDVELIIHAAVQN